MFLKKIYNEKGKTFNNGLFEKCKPIKMKIYIIIIFLFEKRKGDERMESYFCDCENKKKKKRKAILKSIIKMSLKCNIQKFLV